MKFAVVTVVILLGLVGAYYLSRPSNNMPVSISETPTPSVPPAAVEIPPDWKTFVSTKFGFTISHPGDVTVSTMDEGERFLKLGPSQSTGTELYDGILVIIKSGSLKGMSLRDFAQKEHKLIEENPVEPTVTEISPITIAGLSGWAYNVDSLGERRVIFLPIGTGEYLEINDGTVEPANREQTFEKNVSQMLSTLQYPAR